MSNAVPVSLADGVVALARERRVLLGISGGPGSGKSTLAAALAAQWSEHDAVVVPMDGFHLSNAELERRGLSDRKGTPETIDAGALIDLLEHLRSGKAATAPAYSRQLHEPVPDAISITATCRIIIVEGNYLGLSEGPWPRVRSHVDWLWRLDVPWTVARERLIARRVLTGREPEAATRWVDSVDAANSDRVATSDADVALVPSGRNWRAKP